MNTNELLDLTYRALGLVMLLSLPVVLGTAFTGLIVGFLQAITQLQEQSIGTAIKLLVGLAIVGISGRWIAAEMYGFGLVVFSMI